MERKAGAARAEGSGLRNFSALNLRLLKASFGSSGLGVVSSSLGRGKGNWIILHRSRKAVGANVVGLLSLKSLSSSHVQVQLEQLGS